MRIDRWIIEKIAEPAAFWLDRTFGIAPFTVARFFCVALVSIDGARYLAERTTENMVFLGVTMALVVIRLPFVAYVERATIRTGANPEKHARVDIFFRMVWIFWVPIVTVFATSLFTSAWGWSILLHQYFSACDQPPPREEVALEPAVPNAT